MVDIVFGFYLSCSFYKYLTIASLLNNKIHLLLCIYLQENLKSYYFS